MLNIFYKYIIFLTLIIVGYCSEIDITADELYYKNNHLIIASGNVDIIYTDITLNARYAEIDTKTNEFFAKDGIDVIYQGNRFFTNAVFYKIKEGKMTFSDISATLDTMELSAPLYFSSKEISKQNNYYSGENALISTCHFDKRYYQIEAKRFKLYPNDKIIGYDVYGKVIIIPILYSPYYVFKLGYVNPILLFPIIGNNLIEGQYIKTAFDYYLDEDFKSLLYFDYMEKFGWGYGINANIRENRNNPSLLYLYYIDPQYFVFKWDQTLNNQTEKLKYGIHERSMYRLSGGKDMFTEGYVNYENNKDFIFSAQNKKNNISFHHEGKYMLKGTLAGINNTLRLNLNKYENTGTERNNINLNSSILGINSNFTYISNLYGNDSHYQYINNDLRISAIKNFIINTNMTYVNNLFSNKPDQTFTPKINVLYSLENPFLNLYSIGVKTDMYFNLNSETDKQNDTRSVLESLPETEFNFKNFQYEIFSYSPKIIIGNYHERRFIDSSLGNRDVTYKRMLLRNNINAYLLKTDFAKLNMMYAYDQYIYETQDKQYGLNETYQLELFEEKPIKNILRYAKYHNGGYTPFYFDEMSFYEAKRLNNVFSYKFTENTKLIIRDGYNFINNKRDIQYFDFKHNFNNKNFFSIFSGYDYENKKWQNIQVNLSLTEDQDNYFIWATNYDIMTNVIKDSRIRLGKSIGEDEPLKVRSEVVWDNINKKYRLPFIDIIKDLNCVELIYRYREYNSEHTFLFRVNAFPDQTFGTTVSDAGSTFHGWEQKDVAR
jgi:hypothetical protein